MEQQANVIKGCQRDCWDDVQAIQHAPFIFIQGNGAKFHGDEIDDVAVLLDMLGKHRLDVQLFGTEFADVDPCACWWDSENRAYVKGERFYACDGVVRYFGNFADYSHGFTIDTNHAPTIKALNEAIAANLARQQKLAA